ncbi:MAG: HAMP domain-containing sensor histidine kinase [Polyangia bacterium]
MKLRLPVALKLLGIFLVPASLTLLAFALLAHHRASQLLEDELGHRLTGVAASAARTIENDGLALLQPGDEETRTYRNVRRRLEELREAAGVARIYVFDERDLSVCDTTARPIGERDYGLSRSTAEIASARQGRPTSSVLFSGGDGQLYKSAFAHVPDGAFVVGVDGAAPMYEQLATLRSTLLRTGVAGVLLVALLALVAGGLIVTPVRKLARAALRIGRGDLDAIVRRTSRDEIGDVAETLEQMRQLLRARDERTQMMLAGIAHEVRNPLGGLQLYAGLLREDLEGQPEQLAHVKKVERELEHLKNIVSDFLEYARRPRPALVAIDGATLAAELLPLVESGEVEIVTDIEAGVTLSADAGQLRRALLNLLGNAVQASCAGQRVTLTMRAAQDGTRIEVRDEGAGMPEALVEKIWAPFFTTKQKGTGLGLAFTREIVQDHGGTIEVTSTVGAGTTFTIVLPRGGGGTLH